MTKYETYLERKRNRINAEEWNALPDGPKYQNDTFAISVTHCDIKLTRCGQQAHGGKNYWETNKVFGKALAEVIKEDPNIIEMAIDKLREAEKAALVECREYAEGILSAIEEAETYD